MPELPEAENIRRALKRVLCQRVIQNVEVFTPSMREPLLPLKSANLPGRTIVDVRRRGRYVIAELDDGRALLMHFGMSGVVRVEGAEIPKRKHEHVFLHLDNQKIFRFECTRRFSLLKVVTLDSPGGNAPELATLGVEPLEEEFTAEYLHAQSRKRNTPVKVFLMDNAVVCGIGNIYTNETLFAAGIRPSRKVSTLTGKECAALVEHARRILQRAIEAGGTSISDFLNVDGSEGKFSRELLVYGRENLPCPRCGTPIKRIRQSGRSSFYCPHCQK